MNEPLLLHELLWSIDTKYYQILNPEEINYAIYLIGDVHKNEDGNEMN